MNKGIGFVLEELEESYSAVMIKWIIVNRKCEKGK